MILDKEKSVPESGYLERSLAMNLSPLEIVEEDCGCSTGLRVKILSKEHLQILIGKYYKLNLEDEWKLFNGSETDLINQIVELRSTMTCQTPDNRVCQKCFGEKKVRTKYVGIVASQMISERLTQLLLRTFHTSGACELHLEKPVVNFLQNHLIDIHRNENIELVFNDKNISEEFKNIPGYLEQKENIVYFQEITEPVHNLDTMSTVQGIKQILRKENNPSLTPNDYYQQFIELLLSVGQIYSSYAELVFTNLFMVDNNTKFWRYNKDKTISCKLSDKTIVNKISPVLNLLYTPNRQTIDSLEDFEFLNELENANNLSFHEKVFLGKL